MQLKQFRVWKYRNIQDSTAVTLLDNLTCIVGKNQSGKTSLLRALHKFNPKNPLDNFDINRDWPRNERRNKSADQIVCECVFEPTQDEAVELAAISPNAARLKSIRIAKSYANKLFVHFEPSESFPNIKNPDLVRQIALGKLVPDRNLIIFDHDMVTELVTKMSDAIVDHRAAFKTDSAKAFLENALIARADNEASRMLLQDFFSQIPVRIEEVLKQADSLPTMYRSASDYVLAHLPTFIYMEDFLEFQGTALLDQLRDRRDKSALTSGDETILMTLELAGLDLGKIIDQGNSDNTDIIRERNHDLEDAARILTAQVAGRWGQAPYKIQFRCDRQRFFTEIETGRDEPMGMLPLEDQSKGFRWFFSFDLRFMHDSRGTFANCVLLLDEPGLHLHPGGQADLLKRLDEYARNNVLIYTTHLPFLVDLREPARILAMRQDQNHATVTNDLSAAGPDEKLTLQAALGMNLNQHYLIAENNLIVEGVDDFYILSELSNLFSKNNRVCIPDSVEITAAGGASEVVYMATFMVGQRLKAVALFDSDHEGRVQEEKLRTKWITRYKETSSSTILLANAVGVQGDFELEDFFPEQYYIQKTIESHKSKLAALGLNTIVLPQGGGLLCDRVERACQSVGVAFNKGSVAKAIRRDLSRMTDLAELDDTTVVKAEALFRSIANAFL